MHTDMHAHIHTHIYTVFSIGFPSSDEDDGREVVMVDHGSVQRPERLCDYAGKTIPNQSSR